MSSRTHEGSLCDVGIGLTDRDATIWWNKAKSFLKKVYSNSKNIVEFISFIEAIPGLKGNRNFIINLLSKTC